MNSFTTSDGMQIAYVDEGIAKLGTLVFIHGGPGYNSSYLRNFASSLVHNFRTVLYDQRGSGLSSRSVSEESIHIAQYVQDLHELLNHCNIEKPLLLGQSFGGAVALEYALTHSQHVQRLVLENGLFAVSCG